MAWEIASAWHAQPLLASAPESGLAPLLQCTFDGARDPAAAGWLVDESFAALVEPGGAAPPPSVRNGHLEFATRRSVAACIVAAPPLTPVVLTLRVRQPAAAAAESRLLLFDLTEDPSALKDPLAIAKRIQSGAIVGTQRELSRELPPTGARAGVRRYACQASARDADGFETWRCELTTEWGTRALLLVAFGSDGGDPNAGPVAIDDVTLQLVPARRLVGLPAGPLFVTAFDLPRPWESLDPKLRVTKVRCDWESRRALLLPRGAVARCQVARPQGGGALELGLAIVREDRLTMAGPHRERVHVRVGGDARDVTLELQADLPSGWRDLTLPIPPSASEPIVDVELRVDGTDGPDGALVAISDPLLFDRAPAAAAAAHGPQNVVVISLDTLRGDRFGRVVRGKSLTPNLDRLAAQSVVATMALANASYTLPSHVSIFTSQRPGEHGVLSYLDPFQPARSANFAQIAAQHGWATAAFTSGGMLNAEFCGIDLGFDRFGEIDPMLTPSDRLRRYAPLQDRPGYNQALGALNRLDRSVLPWLAGHRALPFVLFVHTYLVHNYQPEPELLAEFTRGLAPTPFKLTGPIPQRGCLSEAWLKAQGHGDDRFEFKGDGAHDFVPARDLPWVEAQYDATVAQADRDVGRILAQIEALGLAESTLVVVTADHGEEFLEHGGVSHARTLFDEILRVPLLIRIPGVAPHRIDDPLELIDLAPTLLARMGLPVDPRMRGADLLARDWEPRQITIHEGIEVGGSADHTLRAARARSGKLVLLTQLEPHAPGFIGDDVLRQLEALGYLGGGAVATGGFFDLQLDPGEQIDLSNGDALTAQQAARMSGLARALLEAPLVGAESSR